MSIKVNKIEARQLRARHPTGKRFAADAPPSAVLAKPKPSSSSSYSSYSAKANFCEDQSRPWQDTIDSPNSSGEYNELGHDNDDVRSMELSISTFVSKLYS